MANTKITSRVIADDAVLTANIADDAVTAAKLANDIAISTTGDLTVTSSTSNKPVVTIKNTNADAGAPQLVFNKDSSSPADNDEVGRIYMYGDDDGGNAFEAVLIRGITTDVSNGSEDSTLEFFTQKAGSQTSTLTLASGNAGIGGAPASAAGLSQYLTIYGGDAGIVLKDATANDVIEMYNGEGKLFLWGGSGGTNGTRFLFDCVNTRLGIGTISPSTGLSLVGANNIASTLTLTNTAHDPDNTWTFTPQYNSGDLTISDDGTERVRISAGGIVLFKKSTTSLNTAGGYIDGYEIIQSLTDSQNTYMTRSITSNSYTFYVGGDGEVHSTDTSITHLSDERLKENIVDIDTGLTEILSLKPRKFDWKDGEGSGKKNVSGFIAQEVESVLPHLVGDFLHEDLKDAKALKTGDMIPTLVKAIQEISAKNDALEARIKTLEDT